MAVGVAPQIIGFVLGPRRLVPLSLDALNRGDTAGHDAAALAAARRLVAGGAGVIALAQFSLARAAPLLRAELGVPVLTTPDSALARMKLRLKHRLAGAG